MKVRKLIVATRVPPALKRDAEAIAKRYRRSFASVLAEALEDYVQKHKGRKP